jgi:hypothetical protein
LLESGHAVPLIARSLLALERGNWGFEHLVERSRETCRISRRGEGTIRS